MGGANLLIYEFPTKSLTTQKLLDHLQQIIKKHDVRPDMVIVDYADLMSVPNKRDSDHRFALASIYESLREIAGRMNLALWTGSQSNRGSWNKSILDVDDLAECFEKAAIGDLLVGLCATQDDRSNNRMRMHFAAARRVADQFIVEMDVDKDRCRYREVSSDNVNKIVKSVLP